MKQERKTQGYTTDWEGLAVAYRSDKLKNVSKG